MLLKNTPKEIRKRVSANGCRGRQKIWEVRSWEGQDIIETRFAVKCTSRTRNSMVWWFGDIGPKTPVWVWCNCPFFKYYLEVADANKGSSDVIDSNGQPPRIRNPRGVPYLCKHLWLVTSKALTMPRNRVRKIPKAPGGRMMRETEEKLKRVQKRQQKAPPRKKQAPGMDRLDKQFQRLTQRNSFLKDML